MNYSEIAKSYQHFYENIIPKARCSPSWNEKSIADAFLWANFYEQIHDKYSDDAESMKNLDDEIHQLTSSRTGVSYCFKNLKQSSAFLCQSFLQNPNIQKNFLQDMISKIKPSKLDFEEASLEVCELDTLCLELLQSLKFITFQDSNQSLYIEIKAELLLDFLKDAIVHLSTEKQYVLSKVEEIVNIF
ncbi:hypothetical protein AVEN_225416-1 [Araneus ventricosus]|uniref:Uncharacterized protein n=1 Tax=Araneus ventricosus TaxID=182803 RepID=A0A4Y2RRG0_ARAVE|nr:hypothetical protein AVEN_225416-1 [Araneus ventricosus]